METIKEEKKAEYTRERLNNIFQIYKVGKEYHTYFNWNFISNNYSLDRAKESIEWYIVFNLMESGKIYAD